MSTNQVWLVTGASGGLGLATVKGLLAAGYRVAATTRDVEKLRAAVGGDYGAGPPGRIYRGVDSFAAIGRKLQAVADEAQAWRALSLSTHYED